MLGDTSLKAPPMYPVKQRYSHHVAGLHRRNSQRTSSPIFTIHVPGAVPAFFRAAFPSASIENVLFMPVTSALTSLSQPLHFFCPTYIPPRTPSSSKFLDCLSYYTFLIDSQFECYLYLQIRTRWDFSCFNFFPYLFS